MSLWFQQPPLPSFDAMTLLVPSLRPDFIVATEELARAWRDIVRDKPRVYIRALYTAEWSQIMQLYPRVVSGDLGFLQVSVGPDVLGIKVAVFAPHTILARAQDFALIAALRAKEFLPDYTLDNVLSLRKVTRNVRRWIPRYVAARRQSAYLWPVSYLPFHTVPSPPMPQRSHRTLSPSRSMSSVSTSVVTLASSSTSVISACNASPAVPSNDSGYASSETDEIILSLPWSPAVIEENFALVRRVFRQLHFKLHASTGAHMNPIFPVTPLSSDDRFHFYLCIQNFFPKQFSVAASSNVSYEVARLHGLYEFCQKLMKLGFFSITFFDAWAKICHYVLGHKEFYDRIFDRVKSNFDQFDALVDPTIYRPTFDERHASTIQAALTLFREKLKRTPKLKKLLAGTKVAIPDQVCDVDSLGILPNHVAHELRMAKFFKVQPLANFSEYENQLMECVRVLSEPHLMTDRKRNIRFMLQAWLIQTFHDFSLHIVGSTASGCAHDKSDLDLVFVYGTSRERDHMVDTLRILFHSLKSFQKTESVTFVNAVVPILVLTLKEPFDNIRVEIGCNSLCGIYTSQLVKRYNSFDHRCHHLILLVKHWANIAGIRKPFCGTLSSITIVVMVIHYLQSGCEPSILPNFQYLRRDLFATDDDLSEVDWSDFFAEMPSMKRNLATTGELLIGFFDYYCHFDFDNYGISISRGGIVNRNEFPLESDCNRLYIEEPFEPFNTARGVWSSEHVTAIKNAFRQALTLLGDGPSLTPRPDFAAFMSPSSYSLP